MLVPGAVDPALGLALIDGLVEGLLVGGFGCPVDEVGIEATDVGVWLVVPAAWGGVTLFLQPAASMPTAMRTAVTKARGG